MFAEGNLLVFLLSLIPALAYLAIIIVSTDMKSVNLKTALGYLFAGAASIYIVQLLQLIFPHLQDYFFTDIVLLNGTLAQLPTIWSYMTMAFIQVGLIEECSKWLAFNGNDYFRNGKTANDSPMAIMFYCCMVATGFAIIENTNYAFMYQKYMPQEIILLKRSISSIVLHMISGLFMGYFIARGRMKITGNLFNPSKFNILSRLYPKARRITYTIIGILFAVFIHGVYDFNFFSDNGCLYNYYIQVPFIYNSKLIMINFFHKINTEILIFGLIITYFMAMRLSNLSRQEKQLEKISKDD